MISGNEHSGGKKHKVRSRSQPADVIQERIEFVADLLANGERTGGIRRKCARFNVGKRQIDEYTARAREWILKRAAGMSKAQAIADSIAFYEQIAANTKNDVRDRMEARKQIDLIFGTHSPRALAIREIPLPQSSADEMERQTNPGMLNALELVYGESARNSVIEIESKLLQSAPLIQDGKKKKKLALI